METIKNHLLFIDNECPMCKMYSKAFEQANILEKGSVKNHNFTKKYEAIDYTLSKDKIALLDTKTNKTYYGIDSLVKILSYRYPVIEKITNNYVVKPLLKRLYSFISFNRKVIVPSIKDYECQPSFSLKYRLVYIVFCIAITSMTLYSFSNKHIPYMAEGIFWREIAICIGQSIFQYAMAYKLPLKTRINYVGQLNTVSLIGSIILIFLTNILNLTNISATSSIYLIAFSLTATIMFLEHYRRCKLLEYPKYLSATWLIYRLLVLIIIL
jgi:hypothetical protein